MPNDTESSSQILQVPDVIDGLPSVEGGNHSNLDTRELSEVNLVYNNVAFQLYPGFNITQ